MIIRSLISAIILDTFIGLFYTHLFSPLVILLDLMNIKSRRIKTKYQNKQYTINFLEGGDEPNYTKQYFHKPLKVDHLTLSKFPFKFMQFYTSNSSLHFLVILKITYNNLLSLPCIKSILIWFLQIYIHYFHFQFVNHNHYIIYYKNSHPTHILNYFWTFIYVRKGFV